MCVCVFFASFVVGDVAVAWKCGTAPTWCRERASWSGVLTTGEGRAEHGVMEEGELGRNDMGTSCLIDYC